MWEADFANSRILFRYTAISMELCEVIILSQLLFSLYLRYLRCKYQHPTIMWNVICADMEDFERLNDINQRIWEQGFTSGNLKDL